MEKIKDLIPFSPPHIDQEIIDEVIDALKSGWITTGIRTKKFEKEIGNYCNIENVLAVNSWTAGAELVLNWFGIQEGDEVIVPVYTYCATANIVSHCNAKVVMIDIKDDFTINESKILEAITHKTKAIISVDVGGFPVDYDFMNELINSEEVKKKFTPRNRIQNDLGRILFISDAAHSFGAIYKKNTLGLNCDFTIFSFHAVKNLTTAEGGAICINLPQPFNNSEIYDNLNILTLHGQTKDALSKSQKGAWEYDVIQAGFKCNMTDILAAIGLIEIKRYNSDTLIKRKEIFNLYTNLLSKYEWADLPEYINLEKETSYHLYLLKLKGITLAQRNLIIEKIFERNVSVNVHYKPLPILTAYKNMGYDIEDFPNAKQIWEREITLPVFYSLTSEQINLIVESLVEAYEEVIK